MDEVLIRERRLLWEIERKETLHHCFGCQVRMTLHAKLWRFCTYLSISFFFVIFTFIIGMHCSLVLNKSFKVQTHTHILESLCPFLCLSILFHYSLVGLKMDSYLNKMTTLPFLKAQLFLFFSKLLKT